MRSCRPWGSLKTRRIPTVFSSKKAQSLIFEVLLPATTSDTNFCFSVAKGTCACSRTHVCVHDIGILSGLWRSWDYWRSLLGVLLISLTSSYKTGPKRPALALDTHSGVPSPDACLHLNVISLLPPSEFLIVYCLCAHWMGWKYRIHGRLALTCAPVTREAGKANIRPFSIYNKRWIPSPSICVGNPQI